MMHDNQQRDTARLLYVEDEESTRTQVSRLLEKRGFSCLIAQNGQEGVELFRQHTPEIVLSDIMMPVMNGLDMAREIRKENPDTLFIFITAFSDTRYLLEAIDIGVSQFVVKPVELDKLLAAISRCISIVKLRNETQRIRHLEATSILAGGMAHDFNNLLQVILGYVSLAKMSSDQDSKAYSYLEMAEKGSAQARELGQMLLTFARGGQSSMHVASLAPLISSEVHATGNNTINIELDLATDSPDVRFDEAQMRTVISNITNNALEAMPQGGTLKVKAHGCCITPQGGLPLTPGDYLHLIFSDTGSGISHEYIAKIFDPYFSSKEMGNKKGQGLGLAVCHAIVRKHGGMISAESTPGMGTTIHIWLPAAADTEQQK
jgi:signal transduction histidine kinase